MINLSISPVTTTINFALDIGNVVLSSNLYSISMLPPSARPQTAIPSLNFSIASNSMYLGVL